MLFRSIGPVGPGAGIQLGGGGIQLGGGGIGPVGGPPIRLAGRYAR